VLLITCPIVLALTLNRIRHNLNSTGDLLASYDPAPIQAVFELLQQLCSRDELLDSTFSPLGLGLHSPFSLLGRAASSVEQ
jgi:hypothetical protein